MKQENKEEKNAEKLYNIVDEVTLREAHTILFIDNTHNKLTKLGKQYLAILEKQSEKIVLEKEEKMILNKINTYVQNKVNDFMKSIKLIKLNNEEDIK